MLIMMIVIAGRKWLIAKGYIKANSMLMPKRYGLLDIAEGY